MTVNSDDHLLLQTVARVGKVYNLICCYQTMKHHFQLVLYQKNASLFLQNHRMWV